MVYTQQEQDLRLNQQEQDLRLNQQEEQGRCIYPEEEQGRCIYPTWVPSCPHSTVYLSCPALYRAVPATTLKVLTCHNGSSEGLPDGASGHLSGPGERSRNDSFNSF